VIIKYTNFIKLGFVALLREAFLNTATPEEYRYSLNEHETKIKIYRSFPRRVQFYPSILVEADSGDASVSYLGQEIYRENKNATTGIVESVSFSGKLTVPINISVLTKSTTDRERLADLVTVYVRYLFKKKFEECGIHYINIKVSGESQAEERNEVVYKNGLIVDCYTEYENEVPVALINTIEKFNVYQCVKLLEVENCEQVA